MKLFDRVNRLILPFLLKRNGRQVSSNTKLNVAQNRLGYHFTNLTLLEEALIHRSSLNIQVNGQTISNERLEFLGDAVLDLIVSEQIFLKDHLACEGTLTKKKCNLVSGKMLSKIALDIGLGEFIMMSENEERSGGRKRPSILEDTFEAVLGAIYLDGGLQAASNFLKPILLDKIEHLVQKEPIENPKSELLEFVQRNVHEPISYHVIREEGPDHEKIFHVVVRLNERELAIGKGTSKKTAEQNAAKRALQLLKKEYVTID